MLSLFAFCGVANANTNGYINCKTVVVYKEAPLSTSHRTIVGSLSEKTIVSMAEESYSEYYVGGGGLIGYVNKYCVTLGTPPSPVTLQAAPSSSVNPLPMGTLDCKRVHDSEGCKTFNEMVVASDKAVKHWDWVCFTTSVSSYGKDAKGKDYSYGPSVETEDKFYLITHVGRDKGGLVFYEIFDKGISSEVEMGQFTTNVGLFSDATKSPPLKFTGRSTEDAFSSERRFRNRENTITTDYFTLRTATGRFTRELTAKTSAWFQSESGYCMKHLQ